MDDARAQVFTLEAVLAALVVLAGLVFAIQAVVLTPSTSGSTQAPADASQLNSVLSQSVESGTLRRAVLDWGGSGFQGTPADREFFTGSFSPPNNFLRTLEMTFDATVAYNVIVHYEGASGDRESQRMVYNGAPGDGAVRADAVVTLYDYDSGTDAHFTPDVSGSAVHNVVEVEVIAWRA